MRRHSARVLASLSLALSLSFTAGCGQASGPLAANPASSDQESSSSDGLRTLAAGAPPIHIVVLQAGHRPEDVASSHGLAPTHVYTAALNGFAAPVPAGRLNALRNDPRVAYLEADQPVSAWAKSQPSLPPAPPPQSLPTGVNRVDADLSPTARIDGLDERVGVAVAVIDTGIDLKHPDLNAQNGATFVAGTRTTNDDNGHGTHVAGIIGALDNGIGVVGVAPGATLVAVKVLNKNGDGWMSDVIKGVDWVTANQASKNIRVANMSLGGGASTALDDAVRNSIAAGITYAIAAGNSSADAANSSPPRVAEAITVSAIADSDGQAGGSGSVITITFASDLRTYDFQDDTFARTRDRTGVSYTYSNYGSVVDIAAPGTSIYSTYKGSSYATLTGTSMAAPHVAGAAALVLAGNPGFTPQQVRDTLVDPLNATFDYGPKAPGDDPDGIQEPLLNVRNF